MTIRSTTSRPRHGFSLVELLLTLVLILCLAAAAVFSFTAIYRTANLDEGTDRLQGLIRFAQAEAATSGRKIRLQFEAASPASATPPAVTSSADAEAGLRRLQVTWEPDYLTAPGVFQPLTNKGWSEEMVNELVGVEAVKPLTANANGRAPALPPSQPLIEEPAASYQESQEFPSITFYPDGSCDSAEIVLASRNSEDSRRLAVRISGILGSVTSRTVSNTTGAGSDPWQEYDEFFDEPAADGFNDNVASSKPVASVGE